MGYNTAFIFPRMILGTAEGKHGISIQTINN